jgi:hypothetical protein
MTVKPSLIADLIGLLDVERRYEFEERAGIIEFDAEQDRDQAELLALVDLLRSHPAALVGVTALAVEVEGKSAFVLTSNIDAARDRLKAMDVKLIDIVTLADVIKTQFDGLAVLRPLRPAAAQI